MSVEAPAHITLTLKVHLEGDEYVSECVELGVASCGTTIDEAFEAIKDAVGVYLETLTLEGELERVFTERNVRVIPGAAPENGREISVPARPREYISLETISLPLTS